MRFRLVKLFAVVGLMMIATLAYADQGAVAAASDSSAAAVAAAPAPEPEKAPAPKSVVTFAPGKGVSIMSPDGDFSLKIKLFGHLLYTASGGDGPTMKGKARGTEDWEHSLAARRIWLYFFGNIFGKHNKYKIQLGVSPQDLGFKNGVPTKSPLMDFYFTFDYLRDFSFQIGQYRVPFNKQRLVGYANLQFVDRGIGNFEFNLDRDMGFEFFSEDIAGLGLMRYRAGVFLGEGLNGYEASDFGLLYLVRFEVLPLGMFKDYVEGDLKHMSKPGLSLGVAYAFMDDAKNDKGVGGSAPDDGGTTDFHILTADLGFRWAGFSLNGEFYYRYGSRSWGDVQAEDDNGDPIFEVDGVTPVIAKEDPRNGYGWNAQVGYILPVAPVEFVARYGQVRPMGDSTLFTLDEIGAGVNYYIFGPGLALKADYHFRFFDSDATDSAHEVRLSLQGTL